MRSRGFFGRFCGLTTLIVGTALGCGGGKGPAGVGGGGGAEDTGGSSGQTGAPDAAVKADGPAANTGGSGGGGAGSGGSLGVDAAAGAPGMADASSPDLSADAGAVVPGDSVIWNIDNLQSIGGHSTMVLGAPMVIDTPEGKALQFDGVKDAIFVDNHPLAGLSKFTVEIYFRPDPGGAQAQRWFHMNENGGGRVLFETRLTGNNFVLDVFVESKAGNAALYDPKFMHPLGAWYHVAAVVDGQHAHHYVNGMEESNFNLGFQAHGPGQTSIGVRFTKMYFFKGAVRLARFTPRVLTPAEFLKPP